METLYVEDEFTSGRDAEGSDADGTATTTTDKRKWFDERGIKLTIYIQATDNHDRKYRSYC